MRGTMPTLRRKRALVAAALLMFTCLHPASLCTASASSPEGKGTGGSRRKPAQRSVVLDGTPNDDAGVAGEPSRENAEGGYIGHKVVRLSIPHRDATLGAEVTAALRAVPPGTVRAWGEHDATELGGVANTSMLALILSPAQLAAVEALRASGRGLKVAVMVEDLGAYLDSMRDAQAAWVPPAGAAGGEQQTSGRDRGLQEMDWYKHYHSYSDIVGRANYLQDAYPTLCVLHNLTGSTANGNRILTIRLRTATAVAAATPGQLKKVVVIGNQHAREWISAMAPIYMAEEMLRSYGTDPAITTTLNSMEVILIPVLNPDGYEFTRAPNGDECMSTMERAGLCNRLWRKNRQPFRRVGTEGSAYDDCVGVDLNRNWPVDWGTRGGESVSNHPCDFVYPGPSALSEAETWALSLFLEAEQPTALVDLHSYKQLVLAPWSHSSMVPKHAYQLDLLGQEMAAAMSNTADALFDYHRADAGGELYFASGTLMDYAYSKNLLSLSVEMRPLTSYPGFFLAPHLIPTASQETLQGLLSITRQIGLSDWMELGKEQSQSSAAMPMCDRPTSLELTYVADNYPSEVTWRVIEAGSNRIIVAADMTHLSYILCSSGDYIFELADAFGDGLCCNQGAGSLSLTLNGIPVWTVPDSFRAHAQFNFTVVGSPSTNGVEVKVGATSAEVRRAAQDPAPTSARAADFDHDLKLLCLIGGLFFVVTLCIIYWAFLRPHMIEQSRLNAKDMRRRSMNMDAYVDRSDNLHTSFHAWGFKSPVNSANCSPCATPSRVAVTYPRIPSGLSATVTPLAETEMVVEDVAELVEMDCTDSLLNPPRRVASGATNTSTPRSDNCTPSSAPHTPRSPARNTPPTPLRLRSPAPFASDSAKWPLSPGEGEDNASSGNGDDKGGVGICLVEFDDDWEEDKSVKGLCNNAENKGGNGISLVELDDEWEEDESMLDLGHPEGSPTPEDLV